jgi:ferredoxin-NADP reductase
VEVMIKRYDTFGLSAHLHSLKEGDTVELQLVGRDKHAKMNFPEIHLRHKHIGIVTAGTALAPMISVRADPSLSLSLPVCRVCVCVCGL